MKRSDIPRLGVITTRNWIYTLNGDQSKAFFNDSWILVTNKEADLADIKSSDKGAGIGWLSSTFS